MEGEPENTYSSVIPYTHRRILSGTIKNKGNNDDILTPRSLHPFTAYREGHVVVNEPENTYINSSVIPFTHTRIYVRHVKEYGR